MATPSYTVNKVLFYDSFIFLNHFAPYHPSGITVMFIPRCLAAVVIHVCLCGMEDAMLNGRVANEADVESSQVFGEKS